jgi:general secretion pathway protein F
LTTFRYRAYTAQGVITAGTIAADSMDAAIDALYSSGLTPFETSGAREELSTHASAQADDRGRDNVPFWKREVLESNRYSLKELAAFTVELASLRGSGLPLDAAFRIIGGSGARPKTVRLCNGLLKDILGGLQLSEAMARRPEIFPPDYLAIVGAGEAGGATGPVLRQIADLLTRRLEIRNKITSALVYPIVLVVMSLMSIAVIVFVLVPSIAPVFVDAGLPMPGILRALSDLQDNWLSVLLLMVAMIVTGRAIWSYGSRHAGFQLSVDQFKISLPVVGDMIRARDASGFARALGTLLNAGVPMMSAMRTARSLVTNRYLSALCGTAIARVPEGVPLHRAFEGGDLLPATSLRLVAVGEESGQLSQMLMQVAVTLESELQGKIERLVGLLTPILTLVIGGSIGGLMMQVMSAVLSINDLAFR